MKKNTIILLAIIAILFAPQITQASDTTFSVQLLDSAQSTYYSENENVWVNFVATFDANWYSVYLEMYIDDEFGFDRLYDGPSHTFIYLEFTVDEIGNHSIEFRFYNATAFFENDYSTYGLNASIIGIPCLIEGPNFNEPWNSDLPPDAIPPDYDDWNWEPTMFDYLLANPVLTIWFVFCVIMLVASIFRPKEQHHRRLDTKMSGAMLAYKKNVEFDAEAIRRSEEAAINEIGSLASLCRAFGMKKTRLIEKKLNKKIWDDIKFKVGITASKLLKEDNPYEGMWNDMTWDDGPPILGAWDDTVTLPAFSDPTDDTNWRVCQYCGEWNHGESVRCSFCGGRLGRPLGRRD